MRTLRAALFGLALTTTSVAMATPPQEQPLRLAAVFGSNMVLQADAPVTLWGWAEPGAEVEVLLADAVARGRAGADGGWSLSLEAPDTSADPYRAYGLTVTSGERTLDLEGVLFGEVWLASGQSNMEWPVSRSLSAESLIERGRIEHLRMFTAERSSVAEPAADVTGAWQVMDPVTVGDFSAVATHFGLELLGELQRPIGIVHSSWGGSKVEAWMSEAALAGSEAGARGLAEWHAGRLESVRERAGYPQPGLTGTDAEGWVPASLPFNMAELSGDAVGVVWLRRELQLPEGSAAPATLHFGTIDEADEVWLDGRWVGSEGDWEAERHYALSPEVRAELADGHATLVARIENVYGWGGMHGDDQAIALELEDGTRLPLTADWTWKAGARAQNLAPNHRPSHLSNGMLVGLEPLSVRGFLWYQGESNTSEPLDYRELFPALIRDWRGRFPTREDGPLPFYFVQLANFLPWAGSDWPGLREAQRRTLALPRTGMAVTIDVGDPSDIHPRDKRTVGQRLASWALYDTYGLDVVPSGPLPTRAYARVHPDGPQLVVEFETFGSELRTRDGAALVGAVEVVDHEDVDHAVAARIVGTTLVLDLATVEDPASFGRPLAVRYGWRDDPVAANLINALGLPTTPFELEVQ